ncbi:hypothetical protein Bca52824_039564 [Brassica carinata]|uniref:Uncharacterized protein n=1 Tax=Brassica carinata TaxID=52824 RepID=A0A8X7RRD6_BRACI|nr:hypothetical protein Bca52824_039564 [Brassica carinata]
MHVKTTPISGIIPHFVSSNSFLPSIQSNFNEEIDLPWSLRRWCHQNANWISDLIDTDYGSFTIQGPGFSWPVHQPLGVSSNSRTACWTAVYRRFTGRMSPIFMSAVLAKYYGEEKTTEREEKERTRTKCSVLEEGQVSRRRFKLLMWTLRWLHQEGVIYKDDLAEARS